MAELDFQKAKYFRRFQMLFQSGWRHMRLASSLKNVLLNDQVIIKELP